MNRRKSIARAITPDPRPGENIEERWSYRISALAGLVDRQSARRFAQYGLSLVQWRILTRISGLGPCSLTELLPTVAVDRALISREVATMESRGFVRVAADKKDGRKKSVSLTPAGEAKHAEVLPEVLLRHAYLDNCLTNEEREVFARVIEKLKKHISRDLDSEEAES
jgi:DNA-binding MarR family transcriptional regulator